MTITTWACLLIVLLLLILIAGMAYSIRQSLYLFRLTNRNIKDSVQTKFLELTPSSQSLVELAVEVWRLEKRLQKATENLSDNQNKALQNSLVKFQRYLDRNDISLADFTDKKYNEGLNLDVLSIEKDPDVPHSIIKETHEPAVMHKGQLIKKAKVIILEK